MGVTSCPSPLVPNGERAPQAVKNRDRKSVLFGCVLVITHIDPQSGKTISINICRVQYIKRLNGKSRKKPA